MANRILRIFAAAALSLSLAATSMAQGFLRDAEIESTLRRWTDPILEAAGLQPDDVQLFIINDPSLNAFVAGGQRIHMHSGLLIAAETPGQIKGVLAHETGHIAAGHTVTRTNAARSANRVSLVSIGLGVLAIAAGAGDAGAALIASSSQFAAVNFYTHTRAEEATSDQLAVKYLTTVGDSSLGLIEFFENYRYQEVLSEARRFEYFRSHPLSSDRIRSLRGVAEETGLLDKPADAQTQREYEMMRAKLIGFLETPNKVYQVYPRTDTSLPARYARSISAYLNSDINLALEEVDALIAEEPDNPYFHELKGQVLFESGRSAESVAPLERSLELLPRQPLLLIAYGRSIIARGEPGDLEKGENALRDALISEPGNAFAWAQLAITLDKQGKRAEAELATAESAYNIGDYQRANIFAARASRELPKATPLARRASDIMAVTDPRLEENRRRYRR